MGTSLTASSSLIGETLTTMIGQKAVVFPPFSPAVQLKIEAIVRFSLIESVLCLQQASYFPPFLSSSLSLTLGLSVSLR